MSHSIDPPALHPGLTMRELLETYPGARRALFARFHVGGCNSCGYQPEETLAEVCARNEDMPVEAALEHLRSSQEYDRDLQIEPAELQKLLQGNDPPRLLDVRSREEFEAVRLPRAELMTQPLLQEFFHSGDKTRPVVVYCHLGTRSLDAAAYLVGHGFESVKTLAGGIDRWSQEIDPTVRRYRLEVE